MPCRLSFGRLAGDQDGTGEAAKFVVDCDLSLLEAVSGMIGYPVRASRARIFRKWEDIDYQGDLAGRRDRIDRIQSARGC
jgi:hypothetical protein